MTIEAAQQELVREAEAGESLLWYGFPRQGIVLRPSDAFMIPFSLLWGGFAIFWESEVTAGHAPLFFMLWGIPFVLIGLYMIVGRFFVDALQRSKTAYGITDNRCVIVSGLRTRSVKSLPLKSLADVTVIENRSGSGTITLGPTPPWGRFYGGMAWPGTSAMASPAFEMISDARSVYSTLRSAQART